MAEQSDFDAIIKTVGNNGKYQIWFNCLFNVAFMFFISLPYLNLIISLAVPNHWCHVPGREQTNYTLQEWKDLTIPMELNIHGILDYSKCNRYLDIITRNNNTITKCNYGWEYDHTWYDLTASIQNNWVCDNSLVPSNTIAIGRASEVIGSLSLSHLADNIGRKPVFFACLILFVIGRIMCAVTSPWVYLFYIGSFIGTMSIHSAFYCPPIIAMEICRAKDRALIRMISTLFMTLGLIVAPFLMWWLRDWFYFMLITNLPCVLFIFTYGFLIESPRWLASRGKIKQAITQLEKIATTNKKKIPNNLEEQLTNCSKQSANEKVQTFMDLFSSLRLAKNTLIIIYCNSVFHTIYVALTINVGYMNVNPFLQYALQSAASIPAFLIGKWVCDKFGRRWVTIGGFLLCTLGSIITIFLVQNEWLVGIMCICIKFSITLISFSTSLQIMEMYPTCIRQIGISFGSVFGGLLSISSPYIITLGVSIHPMIPYIIYTMLSLLAAISCFFLPETHEHKLPETLEDAAVFGADQNLWGKLKTQKYPK